MYYTIKKNFFLTSEDSQHTEAFRTITTPLSLQDVRQSSKSIWHVPLLHNIVLHENVSKTAKTSYQHGHFKNRPLKLYPCTSFISFGRTKMNDHCNVQNFHLKGKHQHFERFYFKILLITSF